MSWFLRRAGLIGITYSRLYNQKLRKKGIVSMILLWSTNLGNSKKTHSIFMALTLLNLVDLVYGLDVMVVG